MTDEAPAPPNKALGLTGPHRAAAVGRAAWSNAIVFVLALPCCSRGEGPRVVDTRVAADLYFIQEARAGSAVPDEKVRICHLAQLTLDAGYDYWISEKGGRSPTIQAREGEELYLQTIRMYKGVPRADDHAAFDARKIQESVCREQSRAKG